MRGPSLGMPKTAMNRNKSRELYAPSQSFYT